MSGGDSVLSFLEAGGEIRTRLVERSPGHVLHRLPFGLWRVGLPPRRVVLEALERFYTVGAVSCEIVLHPRKRSVYSLVWRHAGPR